MVRTVKSRLYIKRVTKVITATVADPKNYTVTSLTVAPIFTSVTAATMPPWLQLLLMQLIILSVPPPSWASPLIIIVTRKIIFQTVK